MIWLLVACTASPPALSLARADAAFSLSSLDLVSVQLSSQGVWVAGQPGAELPRTGQVLLSVDASAEAGSVVAVLQAMHEARVWVQVQGEPEPVRRVDPTRDESVIDARWALLETPVGPQIAAHPPRVGIVEAQATAPWVDVTSALDLYYTLGVPCVVLRGTATNIPEGARGRREVPVGDVSAFELGPTRGDWDHRGGVRCTR